jgi:NADH-quinone oxidoreductase subunit M
VGAALQHQLHLGVDGISVLFVILNSSSRSSWSMAGWQVIQDKVAQYMAAFLIMSGLINGIFSALDGILFYVFFEASLIPALPHHRHLGRRRTVCMRRSSSSSTRLLGSLLMLVALLYLFMQSGGSFSILDWHPASARMEPQILIFWAFLIFRGQGADVAGAHLASRCARRSADRRFGRAGGDRPQARRLRFPAVFAADRARCQRMHFAPLVITLSLIAVIYIGFVALVQTDMKKLVAYSSISHMGFVTLGFFIFNPLGLEGALVQMISHGFVSGAMFLCIGVLYDRMHSRQIADYGGVVNTMPKFAAFFMLFAMANPVCPPPPVSSASSWSCSGRCSTTSGLASRRHHADPRRGVHAVDVQARGVRQGRQQACGRTRGHQRSRVCLPRDSRGVCAGDGSVSLPLHRSDARLCKRTPAACCREQALSVAWRERTRDT